MRSKGTREEIEEMVGGLLRQRCESGVVLVNFFHLLLNYIVSYAITLKSQYIP